MSKTRKQDSPAFIPPGHADDGRQTYHLMRHQHFFDFARIDVEAAANNHVFQAVGDREVALFVPPTAIARVEPAISHRFGGRFGAFVIALHHVVPPNNDFPRSLVPTSWSCWSTTRTETPHT